MARRDRNPLFTDDQLIELLKKGMNDREIADELGVDRRVIARARAIGARRRKLGLKAHHGRSIFADREIVIQDGGKWMSEENEGIDGMDTMPPSNFLNSLCVLSIESWTWFILWKTGEEHRFTDILQIVDCSRAKLSHVLQELLRMGLVRKVKARYQAVSPAWWVRARRAHALSERCDAIEARMEKLEVSMGARKK